MTFHSTEDRIVKYAFKALEDTGNFKLVNKKVIAPHYTEAQKNRAARSAKLRIIQRVK
jgi:16S rRNA (cytosine1402-N4)-methyltransferase